MLVDKINVAECRFRAKSPSLARCKEGDLSFQLFQLNDMYILMVRGGENFASFVFYMKVFGMKVCACLRESLRGGRVYLFFWYSYLFVIFKEWGDTLTFTYTY